MNSIILKWRWSVQPSDPNPKLFLPVKLNFPFPSIRKIILSLVPMHARHDTIPMVINEIQCCDVKSKNASEPTLNRSKKAHERVERRL